MALNFHTVCSAYIVTDDGNDDYILFCLLELPENGYKDWPKGVADDVIIVYID
jgi:hypothetical protein